GSVTTQGDEASVHVRAVDAAGNTSSMVSDSICIDTVPPVVTDAEYPELAGAGAIEVSIHFQDDRSGMSDDHTGIDVQIQVQNSETPIQLSSDPNLGTDLWAGSGVVLPGMNDSNAVLVISGARDKAGNVMVTDRDNRLEIDTQSPPRPLSFAANSGPGGSVTLTWESPSTDVASYRIYDSNELLDIVSGEATEWEGILPDGEYEFGILAVDDAGNEGSKSLLYPVEVDSIVPTPITNLESEDLPGARIRLSWHPSPSSDVSKYEIIYHSDGSSEMTSETTHTIWESDRLEDGIVYTLTVTAVDEVGNKSDGRSVETPVWENKRPAIAIESIDDIQHSDVHIKYRLDDREKESLSIICQYSLQGSNRWYDAEATGKTESITVSDYSGEIKWNSRTDIPSTSSMKVEFRITPADGWEKEPYGEPSSIEFHLVNLLGDYDDNERVDDMDMTIFRDVWEEKDISRELGSKDTEGEPPDLTYAPDGVMDFEDLRIFSLMWMWFAEKNVAAPILWSANNRTIRKPVMEMSEDSLVKISLPSYGLMGSICIEYDPSMVNISSVSDTGRSNVVLLYDTTHPGRTTLAFSDLNQNSEKPDTTEVTLALDWQSGVTDTSIVLRYDIRDIQNRIVASGTETREMRQSPEESALLQNYPNPFNPETWIPYHLSESSIVVIHIYSASGQLVRTIDLGFKDAGYYSTKEKTAYWDGQNDDGEQVSSGLYFYQISAGSFSAMKKMTILR
ncbi:fibronectin type III domain-containing protein, partial [Candidatus Poribacteria bacterium]